MEHSFQKGCGAQKHSITEKRSVHERSHSQQPPATRQLQHSNSAVACSRAISAACVMAATSHRTASNHEGCPGNFDNTRDSLNSCLLPLELQVLEEIIVPLEACEKFPRHQS